MLLFVILWGCSNPAPEPTEPPNAEADRAALRAHMQGHLAAVDAVRDALVAADLAEAKRANRSFLDHKVAFDLPGDWVTHVAAMGEAAVALDQAPDLPTAATHAAEVATACGGCHQAVGAQIVLPSTAPTDPPDAHGPHENFRLQSTWHALITRPAGANPTAQQAAEALTACAACHAKPPESP